MEESGGYHTTIHGNPPGDGISPVPTPAPRVRFRNAALAPRDLSLTCGVARDLYSSQSIPIQSRFSTSAANHREAASPYICPSSAPCQTSGSWFGCGSSSNPVTACYDGTATQCRSGSSIGIATRCWYVSPSLLRPSLTWIWRAMIGNGQMLMRQGNSLLAR